MNSDELNIFEKVLESALMRKRLRDTSAWERFRQSRIEEKFRKMARQLQSMNSRRPASDGLQLGWA